MPRFPLLHPDHHYRACTQNLDADPVARVYWLKLFREQMSVLKHAVQREGTPAQQAAWPQFESRLLAGLDARAAAPHDFPGLSVLTLCHLREDLLIETDIGDPFATLTARENDAALALLPDRLTALDDMPPAAAAESILRGALAANLADMGSPAAIAAYEVWNFDSAIEQLPQRPWTFDTLEAAIERLTTPIEAALIFIDNAGPDFVLGMIPLARFLAAAGTRVTLAANDLPALNDMTTATATAVIERVAESDHPLRQQYADGRLCVVGSGNRYPLIDLTDVSDACAAAAVDCDLLVLTGMGRAVESNFDAVFTRDCLRLALVKNEMVASVLRTPMFTPICTLSAPGATPR